MADIAFIFKWPLQELENMTIPELIRWQKKAGDRYSESIKLWQQQLMN